MRVNIGLLRITDEMAGIQGQGKMRVVRTAQEKLSDDAQATLISVLSRSPSHETQALSQVLSTFVVPVLGGTSITDGPQVSGPVSIFGTLRPRRMAGLEELAAYWGGLPQR